MKKNLTSLLTVVLLCFTNVLASDDEFADSGLSYSDPFYLLRPDLYNPLTE